MKIKFICLVLCACLLCSGCAGKETEVLDALKNEPKVEIVKSPVIDGSWHGYWEISDCSGVWAELDKFRWDCWAEIKDNKVLIWDVDVPREEGLCTLELKAAGSGYAPVKGRMMDVTSNCDDWSISIENDDKGRLFVLRGHYQGKADGKFSFAFYLRTDKED